MAPELTGDGQSTVGQSTAARVGRRAGKREALLAAAVELFLEVGYGGASINQLVERAGGSKSTVYAYFENKEKLFEAVVESVIGEVTASLGAVEVAGLGLRQGLERIAMSLLELVLSERHIGLCRLAVAEARRFPEIGRIYYAYGPALAHRGLKDFLSEQVRLGHVRLASADQAADFFTGMLLHQSIFRRLCIDAGPPDRAEMAATAEAVIETFLGACAVAGQGDRS